jgi:hypothetical protein
MIAYIRFLQQGEGAPTGEMFVALLKAHYVNDTYGYIYHTPMLDLFIKQLSYGHTPGIVSGLVTPVNSVG